MHRRRLTTLIALAGVAALVAGCGGGGGKTTTSTPSTGATAPPTPESTVTARVIDGDTEVPVAGVPVTAWSADKGPPFGAPGVTGADGRWPVPANAAGVYVPQTPTYPEGAAGLAPGFSGEVTVRLYDPKVQAPEYGGGPQRTRYVPGIDLPVPSGKPNWEYTGKSLLEFPPAVANGVAVLTNNSGRVIAFDVATGATRWTLKHTDTSNIAASPAILPSLKWVLISGMDGRLAAYDLYTGKRQWQFSSGGSPIESSPLVIGGTAYVGAWNRRLYAVATDTGKLRWSFTANRDIKGSAVQAGKLVVFGDYSGTVYGVNAETGTEVWRNTLGKRFYGGPAVERGRAVIGDVGGAVIAFDPATGKQLWRRGTGAFVYASPAIANGTVFIGSYTGRFEALNIRNGGVKWSFNAGGRIGGSAGVVGKTVYVSTLARRGQPDRTYGLDVATGKKVWQGDDGRYSPAVAAGRTLFIVGRTSLYAYRTP